MGARERWKEAGIDLIYEQYFPQDTMDFSAYLTTIKYKNPDLVIIATNNLGQAITINKQIMELGGWGDMKVWYCYRNKQCSESRFNAGGVGHLCVRAVDAGKR